MTELSELLDDIEGIEAKLGYTFKDKNLLALAFIHRSFVNENRDTVQTHNERLEFLGDSVLGLLIADFLYRYLPNTPEGELSHRRASLVEGSSCVDYVQKLDVEQHLLLGKGERRNDGRGRDSILSDLFEALIGAIFLDGGIEQARAFLFGKFSEHIESSLRQPLRNWKTDLQGYAQKTFHQPPIYRVVAESGPDHSKLFEVVVEINEEELGRGSGPSKKEAQQAAAQDAWERIEARG